MSRYREVVAGLRAQDRAERLAARDWNLAVGRLIAGHRDEFDRLLDAEHVRTVEDEAGDAAVVDLRSTA